MCRDSKQTNIRQNLILIVVLINVMILSLAYTHNQNWYWNLLLSVPALIIVLAGQKNRRNKTVL